MVLGTYLTPNGPRLISMDVKPSSNSYNHVHEINQSSGKSLHRSGLVPVYNLDFRPNHIRSLKPQDIKADLARNDLDLRKRTTSLISKIGLILSNTNQLMPHKIYTSKSGIRYSWSFLNSQIRTTGLMIISVILLSGFTYGLGFYDTQTTVQSPSNATSSQDTKNTADSRTSTGDASNSNAFLSASSDPSVTWSSANEYDRTTESFADQSTLSSTQPTQIPAIIPIVPEIVVEPPVTELPVETDGEEPNPPAPEPEQPPEDIVPTLIQDVLAPVTSLL